MPGVGIGRQRIRRPGHDKASESSKLEARDAEAFYKYISEGYIMQIVESIAMVWM